MEDEHLKMLLTQLGHRVNEAIRESEKVTDILEELNMEGFDVYMVLDGTYGLNKLPVDTSLTPEDMAFLRILKIRYSEEET